MVRSVSASVWQFFLNIRLTHLIALAHRQVDHFSGPTVAEQYENLSRKWPGLAPSGWEMGLWGSELTVCWLCWC
jgi:hypothetical protein